MSTRLLDGSIWSPKQAEGVRKFSLFRFLVPDGKVKGVDPVGAQIPLWWTSLA